MEYLLQRNTPQLCIVQQTTAEQLISLSALSLTGHVMQQLALLLASGHSPVMCGLRKRPSADADPQHVWTDCGSFAYEQQTQQST